MYNLPIDFWLAIASVVISYLLIRRAMSGQQTMCNCPQCGKPAVSAWKKIAGLGAGKTIICQECKTCLGFPEKTAVILYNVSYFASALITLVFCLQYRSIYVWLTAACTIITTSGYINLKFVPLVIRDQSRTGKELRIFKITVFIAGLLVCLALLYIREWFVSK